jgi:two-component system, NarL family, nitrate/nitrite response regulator NarL
MTHATAVKVLIVESQRLFREALAALVGTSPALTVVAVEDVPEDLVDIADTHAPDVMLISLHGWGERELALLEKLAAVTERTRVLLVTAAIDARLQARAIELGAMGIVLTVHSAETLVKAVLKVHAGELWLDRAQAADVVSRLTRKRSVDDPEAAKISSLTPRERQVVTLVTEGLKNAEIAERLSISEATARNHLTSVLDKLELDNRFQLAVYAFRKGLVSYPQQPALRSGTTKRPHTYSRPTASLRRRSSS